MEMSFLEEAIRVFNTEIDALTKTRDAIGNEFEEIVRLILDCKGKVVFTGMGKPGHIGTKIAATMASLGTPSFFMHPAEAMHGDLGMLDAKDVLVLLSFSGESDEITRLFPALREIGCSTVAITGNAHSSLARFCDYHFIFPHFEEACYMHLAPTSSTTALLVLGDALAVTISRARNYTREQFGLHHPAGSLGKRLLVKVRDLMHSGDDNAVVLVGASLKDAIVEMSQKGLSMVSVVDVDDNLRGIVTDGDLRRIMERDIDVNHVGVATAMTHNPSWVYANEMAVNALQVMNDRHITCLPVLDENRIVVGSLLMQDIIKAGIVK